MRRDVTSQEPSANGRDGRTRARRRTASASRSRRGSRSKQETFRIVVVDDHAIVRQAIVRLLSAEPGFQVVGEAADGTEAVEMAERLAPDVVVIDFAMPRMDGVEATRRIKLNRQETRVIGLSMFDDESIEARMLEAGADTYLHKSKSNERLVSAISENSKA